MRLNVLGTSALLLFATLSAGSQQLSNDGRSNDLGDIYRVSNAKTFSISPKNLSPKRVKVEWRLRGSVPRGPGFGARLEGQSLCNCGARHKIYPCGD